MAKPKKQPGKYVTHNVQQPDTEGSQKKLHDYLYGKVRLPYDTVMGSTASRTRFPYHRLPKYTTYSRAMLTPILPTEEMRGFFAPKKKIEKRKRRPMPKPKPVLKKTATIGPDVGRPTEAQRQQAAGKQAAARKGLEASFGGSTMSHSSPGRARKAAGRVSRRATIARGKRQDRRRK